MKNKALRVKQTSMHNRFESINKIICSFSIDQKQSMKTSSSVICIRFIRKLYLRVLTTLEKLLCLHPTPTHV